MRVSARGMLLKESRASLLTHVLPSKNRDEAAKSAYWVQL